MRVNAKKDWLGLDVEMLKWKDEKESDLKMEGGCIRLTCIFIIPYFSHHQNTMTPPISLFEACVGAVHGLLDCIETSHVFVSS